MADSVTYSLKYGTSYGNTFNLLNYCTKMTGGLPAKKIKSTNLMNHGVRFNNLNFFGGYTAKLSLRFSSRELAERNTLLSIIAMDESITKKWQRITVIGATTTTDYVPCSINLNDGESIGQLLHKMEFDINIISEEAFFIDESETSDTYSLVSPISIANNGYAPVFANYTFTLTSDCSAIDFKLAEGYGFRLEYGFVNTDVVTVEASSSLLNVYLNGALLNNIIVAGSAPFELPTGTSSFIYDGGTGTLDVEFYERRL